MGSDVEVSCLQVEVAGPVKEDDLIAVDSEAKVLSPVVAARTSVQVVEEEDDVEQEVAANVSPAERLWAQEDWVRLRGRSPPGTVPVWLTLCLRQLTWRWKYWTPL